VQKEIAAKGAIPLIFASLNSSDDKDQKLRAARALLNLSLNCTFFAFLLTFYFIPFALQHVCALVLSWADSADDVQMHFLKEKNGIESILKQVQLPDRALRQTLLKTLINIAGNGLSVAKLAS
jgi:hypothetical protein